MAVTGGKIMVRRIVKMGEFEPLEVALTLDFTIPEGGAYESILEDACDTCHKRVYSMLDLPAPGKTTTKAATVTTTEGEPKPGKGKGKAKADKEETASPGGSAPASAPVAGGGVISDAELTQAITKKMGENIPGVTSATVKQLVWDVGGRQGMASKELPQELRAGFLARLAALGKTTEEI